jgi:multiple sugar transport system permease protein
MSVSQQAVATGRRFSGARPARRSWIGGINGADYIWATAFAAPYVLMFVAFVVYPIGFGLWLGSDPHLYSQLFADPRYFTAVINTVIYVVVGVNLKLALAFLLSGFFMRKRWWVKSLLVIYILPWAVPALPAFMSIHWLLNGQWGFLNSALWILFGIDGPIWLNSHWLGMGANIGAYIWKNMPFWTVIFIAGRMAIPQELYEAADMDGATGLRRFRYVTLPLLAQLYLVCTLLSTIWSLGDFNAVYFVSGGGPAMSTEVLATLGIRYAFTVGDPRLGVACVMCALPLLVPIVVLLMHKLRTQEVQL